MIAHVLCPGPSLSSTWGCVPRGDDDVVIGVNRAAQLCDVDWLCAGDCATPCIFPLPFLVGWCSQADCLRYAREDPTWRPLAPFPPAWRGIAWEDLPGRLGYSGPTAMLLALHLGAKAIHVYGADMAGEADFTGSTFFVGDYSDRDPGRWDREIRLYQEAVSCCTGRGAVVVRHTKAT